MQPAETVPIVLAQHQVAACYVRREEHGKRGWRSKYNRSDFGWYIGVTTRPLRMSNRTIDSRLPFITSAMIEMERGAGDRLEQELVPVRLSHEASASASSTSVNSAASSASSRMRRL